MAAAFIDPVIIEQGYTWEANFDLKQGATARNLTGQTAYLSASGLLFTGLVSAAIGRITYSATTGTTSAYRFDRIGYEAWMISGTTKERFAVGSLVLSTAVWNG